MRWLVAARPGSKKPTATFYLVDINSDAPHLWSITCSQNLQKRGKLNKKPQQVAYSLVLIVTAKQAKTARLHRAPSSNSSSLLSSTRLMYLRSMALQQLQSARETCLMMNNSLLKFSLVWLVWWGRHLFEMSWGTYWKTTSLKEALLSRKLSFYH